MKHPPRNIVIDWLNTVWSTDLPANAKLVACNLRRYMNSHHDMAWPSVARIAGECSISESTARRALQLLCSEGWLAHQGYSELETKKYQTSYPAHISGGVTGTGGVTQTLGGVTATPKLNKELNKSLSKRFTPPSLEELIAYQEESNISFDPVNFIDYWASIGWKRGRTQMKDWKATARNWARNESNGQNRPRSNTSQNQPKLTPAQRIAEKRRQLASDPSNMGTLAENGGDVRTYLDFPAG